jgi:hypothetical protein
VPRQGGLHLGGGVAAFLLVEFLPHGEGADGDAAGGNLREPRGVRQRDRAAERQAVHADRSEPERPAHLLVEARVSLVIVNCILPWRSGAARAVRVDEVAGEAPGEEPGVGAHEPRRHPGAADERQQRRAAAEDLVGRCPAVDESYLHGIRLSFAVAGDNLACQFRTLASCRLLCSEASSFPPPVTTTLVCCKALRGGLVF